MTGVVPQVNDGKSFRTKISHSKFSFIRKNFYTRSLIIFTTCFCTLLYDGQTGGGSLSGVKENFVFTPVFLSRREGLGSESISPGVLERMVERGFIQEVHQAVLLSEPNCLKRETSHL